MIFGFVIYGEIDCSVVIFNVSTVQHGGLNPPFSAYKIKKNHHEGSKKNETSRKVLKTSFVMVI